MTQILKGAYLKDSEEGVPIIKLENGEIYWYGGPGKPSTQGFFKIYESKWCYLATEQEYNQQEDVFLIVDKGQIGQTKEDEAFYHELRKEIITKLADFNHSNNVLKNALENLPPAERNELLPLFGSITDAVSIASKKVTEFNHKKN